MSKYKICKNCGLTVEKNNHSCPSKQACSRCGKTVSTSHDCSRASSPLARKVYNSTKWKKTRLAKLALSPLCEICESKSITTPAIEVHHKIKIIDDPEGLYWYDLNNLESLCRECHFTEYTRKGK